jgi:hypothetical protein
MPQVRAALVPGWLAAMSLRRVTWADAAGLRLRGMFRTRVVPWSHVRYIYVRPTRGAESAAIHRVGPGIDDRHWVVQAGLVDGTVTLPGTDGQADRTRQFAAGLTADNPGQQWLAIGLDLTAVPTAEGSSQTPLLVTESLRYRANWGLPGMTGTGQTGAPLLCSSAWTLAPGDSARAVVLPLTDAHLSEWRLLGQGDRLRLFEGATGLRPRRRPLVRKHQPPRSQHRHRPVQYLGQLQRWPPQTCITHAQQVTGRSAAAVPEARDQGSLALFVEGPHDQIILAEWFGNELRAAGIHVFPVRGVDNLAGLINSELAMALGIRIATLSDETSTSRALSGNPRTRGDRAVARLTSEAAQAGVKVHSIGLDKPDILCYLDEEVCREAAPAFPGWDAAMNECMNTGTHIPWKRWIKSRYGLPLTHDGIRSLARECQNRNMLPDELALKIRLLIHYASSVETGKHS